MNRYRLLACTLAAMAMGCNQGPPEGYTGGDTGLALARSARSKDSLVMLKDSLLAEKERQLSVQSAMIGDAATTARLISEIDRDLSKARVQESLGLCELALLKGEMACLMERLAMDRRPRLARYRQGVVQVPSALGHVPVHVPKPS